MSTEFEPYTVCFFGEQNISRMSEVGEALSRVVRELLLTKKYVRFLVGRSGDFDYFAAAAVHKVREELNCKNSSLVLVLPYITDDYYDHKWEYNSYYDKIKLRNRTQPKNLKGAYKHRNRLMINCSDLVISYFERPEGLAYESVKYAKKRKKLLILAGLSR